MMSRASAFLALGLFAFAPGVDAQRPGTYLPDEVSLEDFGGIGATTFSELAGRTVLLEFFAYW